MSDALSAPGWFGKAFGAKGEAAEYTYVEAIGRNPGEELGRSHLYRVEGTEYTPMCEWGWNRSDGMSFSISRGWRGYRGLCGLCSRNAGKGALPVYEPKGHPIKWI